jgi:hypothetical protein
LITDSAPLSSFPVDKRLEKGLGAVLPEGRGSTHDLYLSQEEELSIDGLFSGTA